MRVDAVLVTGALVAVLAFSARSVYEELDQDVPFIRWPLVVLQGVGFGVVAYALVRGTPFSALAWAPALTGALMLTLDAILAATGMKVTLWLELVQVLGYGALAVAASRDAAFAGRLIAGTAALVLVLTHTMLLPAEEERRVALGPGMALLVVAWGMLAFAAANSAAPTDLPWPPNGASPPPMSPPGSSNPFPSPAGGPPDALPPRPMSPPGSSDPFLLAPTGPPNTLPRPARPGPTGSPNPSPLAPTGPADALPRPARPVPTQPMTFTARPGASPPPPRTFTAPPTNP